ncbi:MAG: hypothetical protein ACREQM_09665 [Candidatus Dormibacteraceae bacterium]
MAIVGEVGECPLEGSIHDVLNDIDRLQKAGGDLGAVESSFTV